MLCWAKMIITLFVIHTTPQITGRGSEYGNGRGHQPGIAAVKIMQAIRWEYVGNLGGFGAGI